VRTPSPFRVVDAKAEDGRALCAGGSASLMSGAYSPGPGSSAPRALIAETRRAEVPKPPVPCCRLLLNDLLALAAIESTDAGLYDCAVGPSGTCVASRCVDLDAKAAETAPRASVALAKALVFTSYARCDDAFSAARFAAASKAVTRDAVPPKPAFCLPPTLEVVKAPGRASE